MGKTRILTWLLGLLATGSSAVAALAADRSSSTVDGDSVCPMVKLVPERLPDLNIPRSEHYTLLLNGEPTVIGGHTTGFVPTPTAEYYRDGQWHVMKTVYWHDHGTCIPLRSGKVLVSGGNEQPLGIGHTYTVEIYHPETHTFEGFGAMEKKRFFHCGAELANGNVVISGNSYQEDGIECFMGTRQNIYIKDVAQERSTPFIFPVADDDAIIFGALDKYNHQRKDTIIVDRVMGDPYVEPLFTEWHPIRHLLPHPADESFIGDQQEGRYAYLLTVVNLHDNRMAIARIDSTAMRLLATRQAVPMRSRWGAIEWYSTVIVDRKKERGYVMGYDTDYRFYILQVDYATEPAPLTLYYTDPQANTPYYPPILTPEGNLLMVGGIKDNNYTPFATAIVFPVASMQDAHDKPAGPWLYALVALAILAIIGAVIMMALRRNLRRAMYDTMEYTDGTDEPETTSATNEWNALMAQLEALMKEQKPYLNSDLKVTEVAAMLETRARQLSDCIKAKRGCSFTQYVNGYRIDYAQKLMLEHPEMKTSTVGEASGFANETSFFRTFKSVTGMTPREWMQSQTES